MTDAGQGNAQAFLRAVGDILGRRHRMSDLDAGAGTFELHDDERSVRVTLPPALLPEYVAGLGEHAIPDLALAPQDARDHVRARYVTRWIEEMFESDISLSLLEIRLDRTADGGIALIDHRGPARRPFPSAGDDGYWSPDRPTAP